MRMLYFLFEPLSAHALSGRQCKTFNLGCAKLLVSVHVWNPTAYCQCKVAVAVDVRFRWVIFTWERLRVYFIMHESLNMCACVTGCGDMDACVSLPRVS